ncbi:MAG: ParB N-terminal domain-containing protein [Defluviitaleaceae bacterium]|nr:ParB N-terminal domain-containing protein [Defluviitaleaceae bacterium]
MPGKFNVSQLMNEHSKKEGEDDALAFKIEHIHIEQILPSEFNNYSVDDVAELKASIELIGLQQNLLVRQMPENSTHGYTSYELISGHRRHKAITELVSEGKEGFQRVPCKIIKSIDDIQAELQLIFANSTARRLSDYELSRQAQRLKELLTELKNEGYKFTGKKREIIAGLLGVSASQIARYESINKNLAPELTTEFKKGNINITTAYEASRLDNGQQAEALKEHKIGATLTPDNVKKRREKVKKPEIDSLNPTVQELKPCPFCGEKAIDQSDSTGSGMASWRISCSGCKVFTPLYAHFYGGRDAALKAWNARV